MNREFNWGGMMDPHAHEIWTALAEHSDPEPLFAHFGITTREEAQP